MIWSHIYDKRKCATMSGGFNVTRTLENPTQLAQTYTAYHEGGILVSDPTVINTKGPWLQLPANSTYNNTQFDSTALMLYCQYNNQAGPDYSGQLDIAIGPDGSQQIILPNLNFNGGNSTSTYIITTTSIVLPISIEANTPVWARWAANQVPPSGVMVLTMSLWDSGFMNNPSINMFDAIGSNGSVIGQGTLITAGIATKSSYVQLGTASRDYNGFFLQFDASSFSAGGGETFNIDFAIGSPQQILIPDYVWAFPDQQYVNTPYYDIQIPNNTTLWARASYSYSSTANVGVTFYGGY